MYNLEIEEAQKILINNIILAKPGSYIIHSEYDSGKSYIAKKMFDESKYSPKIFQMGSNPNYRISVANELKYRVENVFENTGKIVDVYLDELDDEYSLDILFNKLRGKTRKIILFTNNCLPVRYEQFSIIYELLDMYGPCTMNKCAELQLSVGSILSYKGLEDEVPLLKEAYNKRMKSKKSSNHSLNIAVLEKCSIITTTFYNDDYKLN